MGAQRAASMQRQRHITLCQQGTARQGCARTPRNEVLVHRQHGGHIVRVVNALPVGACGEHGSMGVGGRGNVVSMRAGCGGATEGTQRRAPKALQRPQQHCGGKTAAAAGESRAPRRTARRLTHTRQRRQSRGWAAHGWRAAPRGCCRTPTSPCRAQQAHQCRVICRRAGGQAGWAGGLQRRSPRPCSPAMASPPPWPSRAAPAVQAGRRVRQLRPQQGAVSRHRAWPRAAHQRPAAVRGHRRAQHCGLGAGTGAVWSGGGGRTSGTSSGCSCLVRVAAMVAGLQHIIDVEPRDWGRWGWGWGWR